MKLTSLATLTVLVVRHVYASPARDVLTPSGIPATSGPLFTPLSFDTTGNPSFVSALSSLISSESTAVTPYTSPSRTASSSVAMASMTDTSPTSVASPVVSAVSPSPTPTASATSGTRSLRDVSLWSCVVAGVAVGGALAALV